MRLKQHDRDDCARDGRWYENIFIKNRVRPSRNRVSQRRNCMRMEKKPALDAVAENQSSECKCTYIHTYTTTNSNRLYRFETDFSGKT